MSENNISQNLSEALRNKIPQILREWEKRVRATLPEAQNQSTLILQDHIPNLLDELVHAFKQNQETKVSCNFLGKIHGKQRAKKTKYSIGELIQEFQILRQVLSDELHETGLLNFQNSKILHRHLDEAIKSSVTEFVKYQSVEITEAANKLFLVFKESPAQMAIWAGEDLVFDMANPAYEKAFGDRRLKGKKIIEALPELKGQPFIELIKRVLHTGETYYGHGEMAQIRTEVGGELVDRYFDYVYVQLKDTQGNPYGVYNHAVDVTEKVLRSEELSSTINDLAKEKRIHNRFVLALTHDLRTPLTAAMMSAQLLLRKPDEVELVVKHLPRILSSLERIDQMIQDLLDAIHFKSGGVIELKFSECDLDSLVKETITELTTIHGSRFKCVGDTGISGQWSSSGIRRILENLCTNAIKYGSEFEPITIEKKLNSDSATIIVNNKGNLIHKDDLQKIFGTFHRTDSAKASGHKGWGIGLMLTKGLVVAHKGQLELESTPEAGTSFIITLPLNPIQ